MDQLPHEHETFMKEIVASPYDDMPRLIYADWLDEHSNPRGEFIRVQCQLAHIDPLSGDYHDLNVRNLELLGEHRMQWLNEVRLNTRSRLFFDRGFVRRIKLPAGEFYKYQDLLPPLTPITALWLTSCDATGKDVGAFGCLNHVHDLRLDVSWGEKGLSSIRPIVQSPHLTRLETLCLHLRSAVFDHKGLDMLHQASDKLKTLSLQGGTAAYGPAARKHVDFPNLKRLEVHTMSDLVSRFQTPRLEALVVDGLNDAKLSGMQQMPLEQLTSLELLNCKNSACGALLKAGAFAGLQRISLKNCSLPRSDLTLLGSGGLNGCKELEMTKSNNRFETNMVQFVQRLVDHPLAGSLEKLLISKLDASAATTLLTASLALKELVVSLSEIPNAPEILRAIAPSLRNLTITDSTIGNLTGATFPSLRRLEIRRCQIGAKHQSDEIMASLIRRLDMPELVELRLVACNLGKKTLKALAQASHCPNLRVLDFAGNESDHNHLRMILDSERLPLLRRLRMPIYRNSAAIKKLKQKAGARLQIAERNEAGFYG